MLAVVDPGGGGVEPRLSLCPMAEFDAVDVVLCAVAVVSLGLLGFEELAIGSIPVATAPGATG